MRIRRKRRYRFRRRRYGMKRMRMRSRRSWASRKEVKTRTVVFDYLPIYHYLPNPGNEAQSDRSLIVNDLFRNITIGPAYNQRIGDKIFVKSIRVYHSAYVNHMIIQSVNYVMANVLLRLTWTDVVGTAATPSAAGSAVPYFFEENGLNKMTQPINRRLFKVWRDKVYRIGGPHATSNNDTYTSAAAIARWAYTIPVNKSIIYQDTVVSGEVSGGIPKDDTMRYSMLATAGFNNDNSILFASNGNFKPKDDDIPLILSTTCRVYYTDS